MFDFEGTLCYLGLRVTTCKAGQLHSVLVVTRGGEYPFYLRVSSSKAGQVNPGLLITPGSCGYFLLCYPGSRVSPCYLWLRVTSGKAGLVNPVLIVTLSQLYLGFRVSPCYLRLRVSSCEAGQVNPVLLLDDQVSWAARVNDDRGHGNLQLQVFIVT